MGRTTTVFDEPFHGSVIRYGDCLYLHWDRWLRMLNYDNHMIYEAGTVIKVERINWLHSTWLTFRLRTWPRLTETA